MSRAARTDRVVFMMSLAMEAVSMNSPVARLTCLAVLTLAAACGSSSEAPKPPPRTAAQQRAVDSTLGASNLPGARGVKGALAVSDSAAAKRRMEDSIAANP
ncbi:MAG: hypothetical protein K8S21_06145 [Gemmatimonadetes bacterium]|nr:hypothetical protein [Gemmatimonadota bacterium]